MLLVPFRGWPFLEEDDIWPLYDLKKYWYANEYKYYYDMIYLLCERKLLLLWYSVFLLQSVRYYSVGSTEMTNERSIPLFILRKWLCDCILLLHSIVVIVWYYSEEMDNVIRYRVKRKNERNNESNQWWIAIEEWEEWQYSMILSVEENEEKYYYWRNDTMTKWRIYWYYWNGLSIICNYSDSNVIMKILMC